MFDINSIVNIQTMIKLQETLQVYNNPISCFNQFRENDYIIVYN